jgi:hypothetical protein
MLSSRPGFGPFMASHVNHLQSLGNFFKILNIRNLYLLFCCDNPDPGAAAWIQQIAPRSLRRLMSEGPYDMMQLLSLARDLECSEPKDRIFAMAAVMNDSELSAIGEYSPTAAEIYTQFAVYQVQRGKPQTFAILDRAGLAKHNNIELSPPSWVPDWTSQGQTNGTTPPLSGMR